MKEQLLDSMDIERERGITIKAQTASVTYKARDGLEYYLNLIDTPGHVDFTYEVSRSLSACEGALLVVDATQGVEAQTVANVYIALGVDAEIIPVVNKIDLPSANVDNALREVEDVIGLDTSIAVKCSAKTGEGIDDVLEAIVAHVPPPKGNENDALRALIIDSWFDPYVGVVVLVRVFDGTIRVGEKIKLMATGGLYEVMKLGVFTPAAYDREQLQYGEVGYVIANIKTIRDARVGDTVTNAKAPAPEALSGFKEAKPMVYSGIFPTDTADYDNLKDALEKLQLNDSAITVEPEKSDALGLGYRVGFLGLLHMDVVQERLEREYDLDLVTSAPSVVYKVALKQGGEKEIRSPSQLPPLGQIQDILEPIARVTIHSPEERIGGVIKLCEERRGTQIDFTYVGPGRVMLTYDIPYGEVVFDFFDKLKSISRGYASMDYEIKEWRVDDLVRVDILINGDIVDALSIICHREQAYFKGGALARKLKDHIPRQQYEVVIQAAIGSKVVARTNVKALRKDVTAKCYGGDISRKRKLLEKQKEGKKRMKAVGTVEIPQEAFLAVLRIGEDEG
jgi:GTP-binding protein LepA